MQTKQNIFIKTFGCLRKKTYFCSRQDVLVLYSMNMMLNNVLKLGGNDMARPIRETPILYGKDAERFLAAVENVKPASQAEKDRVLSSYEEIRQIADFVM